MIPWARPSRGPRTRDRHDTNGAALASRNELSTFLAGVERRAFKQAVFAVRDEDAALDIVQDAMLRLAEKYGANPADELPMLFQRILQNAIRDCFRRQKVRSTVDDPAFGVHAGPRRRRGSDPLETLEADGEPGTAAPTGPAEQLEQSSTLEIIEKEIKRLPPRQREAFLLRYWEELDVAETAAAMGCSEGSVKTHCSRATHSLAAALTARGIEL